MGSFNIFASGEKPEVMLQASLTMKAAASDDSPATFDILANTGEPMRLPNFPLPVVIDIKGVEFAGDRLPVLDDHATGMRLGVSRDHVADIEASEIRASGDALPTAKAQEFVVESRAGFPFQSSVGANVLKQQRIGKGRNVTVNGKTFHGPLIVARKTKIHEFTATVFGADKNTAVTVSASQSKSGVDRMNKEFKAWLEAMALVPDDLTEDQVTTLEAKWTAEKNPPKVPVKTVVDPEPEPTELQASRKRTADELRRTDEIQAAFRGFEGEEIEFEGEKFTSATLKAYAIEHGTDPRDVKLAVIVARRPEAKGPAIHTMNAPEGEAYGQAIQCSMARQYGMQSSVKASDGHDVGYEHAFSEQVLEASDRPEFRTVSLHSMMHRAIMMADGSPYMGAQKSDGFIKAYASAERTLKASGGPFSTLTVTNILENVGNKMLLARFAMQVTTYLQIANVKPLNDFKAHSLYRLDENMGYLKVGKSGSLKSSELTDTKRTVQAETYGRLIALTRQDIRNDDLGAFVQIMNGLADGNAWAKEAAVWGQLLAQIAGGVFFTVALGNLQTDDLTIAGCTAAEELFSNHVGAGGKPIGVLADRLVVGTQDSVVADQINNDVTVVTPQTPATDAGANAGFATNPHNGKWGKVKTPYLNNTNIRNPDGTALTGQDSDQWLMVGNPAMMAVVQLGLLDGRDTPFIDSAETSFDTLGMQWRGYTDFGVAEGDTEAGVLSTGVGGSA